MLGIPGLAIDRVQFWASSKKSYAARSKAVHENADLSDELLDQATTFAANAYVAVLRVAALSAGDRRNDFIMRLQTAGLASS